MPLLKLKYQFWAQEDGQDLVEYALILLLIALSLTLIAPGVRDALKAKFDMVSSALRLASVNISLDPERAGAGAVRTILYFLH